MSNFHRFQNFRQFYCIVFANLIEKRQTSRFSGIWREIRKKIHQNFAEKNAKFDEEIEKKSESQLFNRENFWRSLTNKLRLENGAKECIV